MRDRAWRRYIEERIVIRRIRTIIDIYNYWRGFEDVNGYSHLPPLLKDFIGTQLFNRLKTHSVASGNSRYKSERNQYFVGRLRSNQARNLA